MGEHEVVLSVTVLNLSYELRGFDAIRDFKLWLDEHASAVTDHRPMLVSEAPTHA